MKNVALHWTVAFGYRPWQAFAWFALLLAIGTTLFGLLDDDSVVGREGTSAGSADAGDRRWFHAVYTADLLLPVVSLGYRTNVTLDTTTAQALAAVLTVLGWVLGVSAVAAVTHAIRRR